MNCWAGALNATLSSEFGGIITFFALLAQQKRPPSVAFQVKGFPF
jgi:hypothetical protein